MSIRWFLMREHRRREDSQKEPSCKRKRRRTHGLFLSEGLLLGVLGTAVGTAISLIAIYALNVSTVSIAFGRQENIILAPTIAASDVIFVGLLTILVSVLASLQPAWKASRMDPITALRHV